MASSRKTGALPKVKKRSLSIFWITKVPEDDGIVSEESSCDDGSISTGSCRSWKDIILDRRTQQTRIRSDTPELSFRNPEAYIEYSNPSSPECYEGWEKKFNNDNRCFREPCIEDDPEMYCGAGIVDPFGANLGDTSPQSQSLLHHFTSILCPSFSPIIVVQNKYPLSDSFFPNCLNDPALYYATLAIAASHIDAMNGRGSSRMSLLYRGEAIRLVNQELGCPKNWVVPRIGLSQELGCPKKRMSDTSIAAVALLAGMENICGNVDVLKVHLDALEKLVGMRGGSENLGNGGILHTTVFCQDILAATMMGTKPRFEPTKYRKLVSHTRQFRKEGGTNPKPKPSDKARDIPGLAICGGYHDDFVNIFQDLYNISTVLQTVNRFTLDQMVAFESLRSRIEHSLLCLPKQCPYHGIRESHCVYEPNRLAALIYSNYVFRGFTPKFPLLMALKQSLTDVLSRKEQAELEVASEDDILSGAVLWIYCMGAILALTEKEKDWFAVRIAKVIIAMGLDDWSDCDYQLKSRFLWTSKMSDVMFCGFFDRIALNLSIERVQ
ncbi:hypothetical protein MMC26_002485 [Xylographa opegraphella]|nr:hypothetical protein [Xylographa opegraphella]